jgi:hypothetical protein
VGLYVFEHEDFWEVTVTFVAVTRDECRITVKGRARDPNHNDGSKAETSVSFSAPFPLEKLKK